MQLKSQLKLMFVILATALMGGCAGMSSLGSSAYSVQEAKNTAGECCETLSSLQFKQLPANQKVRLAVNRDDAIYHYAKGQSSFVEALTLPLNSQSSLIQIESEVVHNRDSSKKHIFYPVLTFLDADKKVIKTIDPSEASLQSPLFARAHMRIAVRLTGDIRDARYVLLHTTQEKLNYAISKTQESMFLQTGGFDTMIFAPIKDPRYRINFGAEGWVKILVST